MISSNTTLTAAPGNVALSAGGAAGLGKDSVVNVSQIATLDRRTLTDRIGHIDLATIVRIDDGHRLALGLAS